MVQQLLTISCTFLSTSRRSQQSLQDCSTQVFQKRVCTITDPSRMVSSQGKWFPTKECQKKSSRMSSWWLSSAHFQMHNTLDFYRKSSIVLVSSVPQERWFSLTQKFQKKRTTTSADVLHAFPNVLNISFTSHQSSRKNSFPEKSRERLCSSRSIQFTIMASCFFFKDESKLELRAERGGFTRGEGY